MREAGCSVKRMTRDKASVRQEHWRKPLKTPGRGPADRQDPRQSHSYQESVRLQHLMCEQCMLFHVQVRERKAAQKGQFSRMHCLLWTMFLNLLETLFLA